MKIHETQTKLRLLKLWNSVCKYIIILLCMLIRCNVIRSQMVGINHTPIWILALIANSNLKLFKKNQKLQTFKATRTAWVLDFNPTVADPCLTASMAYSIWCILPWNCKTINWMLQLRYLSFLNNKLPEGSKLWHHCHSDSWTERIHLKPVIIQNN